ncbi:hypothetical protein KY347_04590 [Candidatus Woesearchaeota archaeon]|nr:hypothetical protein [Candidatus Woesearchaeota archaeon]
MGKKQAFGWLAVVMMFVLAAGFVSALCPDYDCQFQKSGVFSYSKYDSSYPHNFTDPVRAGTCIRAQYNYWKLCGYEEETCDRTTGKCVEEDDSNGGSTTCPDRCYGPDRWGNNFVVSMNKLPSGNDCSVPFEGCTYTNCLKCESAECANAKCAEGRGSTGGDTGDEGVGLSATLGSFSTPKSYRSAGETAELSVNVRNTGNAAFDETTKVWFFVKKPGSTDYEAVSSKSVSGLMYTGQASIKDVYYYWQIPKDAVGGKYEFVAQVFAVKKNGEYYPLSNTPALTINVEGSD